MEEAKIRDQDDEALDFDEKAKSITEHNQKKVAHLIRVQELNARLDNKWTTEAVEVTLSEKDDSNLYSSGMEKRSTYSDMKNKKLMMLTINLPSEYLVSYIKIHLNSLDSFKNLYRIHNIEAY